LDRNTFQKNTARYKELLNKYSLTVSGFRTGLIYGELGFGFSHPDIANRTAAVEAVCSAIDLTAMFPGAKTLNGLVQGPPVEGNTITETKRYVEDCIRQCIEYMGKYECFFCVEPVNRYELSYNNTLDEVMEMISRIGSSKLQLLIDTFHMNIEETNMLETVQRNSQYIGAVHFMDSNRLPPGYGHSTLMKIYNTLEEEGYDGYYTIEMGIQNNNDEVFFTWAEKGLEALEKQKK
jgi:5-keto-L-gluconate epimerase